MSLLAEWRALRQHPVYLREKGAWGRGNPYYATFSRYSPLLMIGAMLLGVCGAGTNLAVWSGGSELFLAWCLLCLPGMAMSALVLFGSLMAPALAATSISHERVTGTWDILRVVPLSQRRLVLAKLLGGLARLRLLWVALFGLSLFQGLVMVCSIMITSPQAAGWGWLLGLSTAVRPWLEVLFAALAGMWNGIWIRSAVLALVASLTAVFLFKLLNSSLLWMLVVRQFAAGLPMVAYSAALPTASYALAVLLVGAVLLARADRIEIGD